MDKQLFDDAIGEVPPPTINVEATIVRGRRAARLRSVANPVVAAGVAVVLVAGVIAFTMTRGDAGGGVQVGGPPASTTSSTSASASAGASTREAPPNAELPDACSRPDLESGAEVAARLTPVLKAAVQAQRPDVQLETNPGNEYPAGVSHGPLDFFYVSDPADAPICDADSYLLTRATTKAAEGQGNILVAVQPIHNLEMTTTCDPPGSGEQTFCEKVTGPNGEVILKQTRALEGGTTMTRVDVVRTDGTWVTVSSEDINTSVKSGNAPTATAPPLNHDQLIAIGTDPGMTLFP